MHRPSPSRGVQPRRYVRLALTAALAVVGHRGSPRRGRRRQRRRSRPTASHRRGPTRPKKPKRSVRLKHRAPIARASLCSAPLVGDWHNINASTNAMTRALVSFTCSDVILCDTSGHCTGGDSYYSTQMFGKCSPTDCNWGTVRAYPQYDGWIKSTYNFGFKTSSVWLKTYSYYGLTYLRVWVYNDFTPCGRPHGLHDRRVVPALAAAVARARAPPVRRARSGLYVRMVHLQAFNRPTTCADGPYGHAQVVPILQSPSRLRATC